MKDIDISDQDTHIALTELCTQHPDDPNLHQQLAEQLLSKGHEIAAVMAARRAYRIFIHENPHKAEQLHHTFGSEITTEVMNPLASSDYSPLADIFGALSSRLRTLKLSEGSLLFRKDEPADSVYLILSGELAVSAEINGQHILLNYLHQGAIVGEAAIQPHATRSANVSASSDATLLRFSREEIQKAFAKHTELHIAFSKQSMLRYRMLQLCAIKIFAHLPTDLLYMMTQRTWIKHYQAGDLIKPSHTYMADAEFIIQGIVHLYDDCQQAKAWCHENCQQPKLYCGRMTAGHLLGLHRLTHRTASSLAYVAETDCTVICMDFITIQDVMGISRSLEQKLKNMEELIQHQVTQTIALHTSKRAS